MALEAAAVQAAKHSEGLRAVVAGAGALLLAVSFVAPVELVATQWADGRRAAERWLEARAPGTTIETYGPLVYQPRFADAAARGVRITRIDPAPVAGRNPQIGMNERQGRITDVVSRSPDVVLLTEGFAGAFPLVCRGGCRVMRVVARRARPSAPTTAVVRAAVAGTLPAFRLCFVAAPRLPSPLVARQIHLSVGQRIWVLARTDGLAADCGVTN